MAFAVQLYVDADGCVLSAKDTDQAGGRDCTARTYRGRPVAYAGAFYGSQLAYGAARACVLAAWETLLGRLASRITGLTEECPMPIQSDRLKEILGSHGTSPETADAIRDLLRKAATLRKSTKVERPGARRMVFGVTLNQSLWAAE